MCRRFFIEVTGLDDDKGEEQLQQAGVPKDSIMVVDSADPVEKAIREVTGYSMPELKDHSRNRNLVAARTLYVHFSLLNGVSINKLSVTLRHTHIRIMYYRDDYERKMFGDRAFRLASAKVLELLQDDPDWEERSSKAVAPTKSRKRRKRKRMRRLRAAQAERAKTAQRQLEIKW